MVLNNCADNFFLTQRNLICNKFLLINNKIAHNAHLQRRRQRRQPGTVNSGKHLIYLNKAYVHRYCSLLDIVSETILGEHIIVNFCCLILR
jgi:hypothetical protein